MSPRVGIVWVALLCSSAVFAQTSTFIPASTSSASPNAPAPPPPPSPPAPPAPPSPPVGGWQTPVMDYPPPPVCPPAAVYPPPGAYAAPAPMGRRQTPQAATEGFFAMAEFYVGYPTFQIGLNDTPTLGDNPAPSLIPATPNSFISPTFELGYRFATVGDYLALNYRFLFTDTNSNVLYNPPGVAYPTRTTFYLNQFDLDYGLEYSRSLTALWSVGSRIGARAFNLGYSTQTQKDSTSYEITSNFWGGGPHGRFEVERRFGFFRDLAVFGRADGALALGSTNLRSTITRPASLGVPAINASSSNSVGRGIPMLNVQTGLSYAPEEIPGLILTGGYVYEHWWSVGRMSTTEGNSFFNTGQIYSHGWFVRAQVDF